MILGVIGVFYLLFFPISTPNYPIEIAFSSSSLNSNSQKINIIYDFEQQPKNKQRELNSSNLFFLKKKVKFATEDNKGKYKIMLIDENRADENVTIQKGYKIIKGWIDDSSFVLKIPIKSLENGKLKLLIQNNHSNVQKEIDANFLQNVRTLDPDQRLYLRLTFDNLSNYSISTVDREQKILPVP